jgi:hypothetical protein
MCGGLFVDGFLCRENAGSPSSWLTDGCDPEAKALSAAAAGGLYRKQPTTGSLVTYSSFYAPAASTLGARVLNSYFSMLAAAMLLSDRTTRPTIISCSGHVSSSLAGQSNAICTRSFGCRGALVVNRIPLLLMSKVFPDPLTSCPLDCMTVYRTSASNGKRNFRRRSHLSPKFGCPGAWYAKLLPCIFELHQCMVTWHRQYCTLVQM